MWELRKNPILSSANYVSMRKMYVCVVHSRVGWFFFTFSTKVPLRFVTCLPKVSKQAKKKHFWPGECFIIGHDFLGRALYKGPKFCIHYMDFMGIKRSRILRRFQKYKFTSTTKCTKKKLFKKKECLYYTVHSPPPVYQRKSLSWDIFFRCILSLR
jgi:hypothetical protein